MKKIIKKTLTAILGEKLYMKLWKVTVCDWRHKKRGKKIQEKNEACLIEFKNRFNPKIFIETGTYQGDMTNRMKNHFEKVYSIELGDRLYEKAKKRFANDKNVEIIHGDSGKELLKLLPRIKEPALFWLDAHDSGGVTARGSNSTPIEQELETIFNHPIKNHVILIDDAREFTGKDGYPTAETIKKLAQSHNYLFGLENDNFRIYPKNSN